MKLLEDRAKTHGSFEDVATTAQHLKRLFSSYFNVKVMPNTQREALAMIATKLARILNGDSNDPDHWIDIAGYATLVANELSPKVFRIKMRNKVKETA